MSADPIVAAVVGKLLSRSDAGQRKYGCTLADANGQDWLRHLQEELMDAVLYIEAALKESKQ